MAKILIEVDDHGQFNKGDMLIFDGHKFVAIKKEHVLAAIPHLQQEIDSLIIDVKLLKLAVRYDHGEISKEEYEELCLGVK